MDYFTHLAALQTMLLPRSLMMEAMMVQLQTWSCGVVLFVLLAGYLPFEDDNLMILYNKISTSDFTFPSWLSFGAKRLLTKILDPNPMTRVTMPEILEDEWFKKGYKPPVFEEKYDANLDDVESVFKDSEENHVREEKEQPTAMNAFELISMSKGLNLGNLFDAEQEFKRETRFTSKCPAKEIINKIEEAARPLGFDVQKKNYKMRLENVKAGRKGNLNVATEVTSKSYYILLPRDKPFLNMFLVVLISWFSSSGFSSGSFTSYGRGAES